MSYFYIFLTMLLAVYGQIAIKWQVVQAGSLPDSLPGKINFLVHLTTVRLKDEQIQFVA